MGGSDFETVSGSRAGLIPLNGGEALVSNQMGAPHDVAEFCGRLLIQDDVVKTLTLARQHFAVLGEPRYEIIEDPESQECYLAIHVNAAGSPEEVFEQSESFLDAFVANVAPGRQHHISLVYHSVSA